MPPENLTKLEATRLSEPFNFTDGYMHRKLTPSELTIINKLPQIFNSVSREKHQQLEREFIQSYLRLAKQSANFRKVRYLFCTSASMSLEIIANYLRLNHKSLTLIEPCIDTLVNILKRHSIKLQPIPDELFNKKRFLTRIKKLNSEAICLVLPNNPTGSSLSKENFIKLVDYCKNEDKTLIIDASCRLYSNPRFVFDQYKILITSKVNFIIVENTGKVFPTKNLKVSVLAINPRLCKKIDQIYSDFILYVSPFTVKLLSEFVNLSLTENSLVANEIVKVNRQKLYAVINGTILKPKEDEYSSTSWLKIEGTTADKLKSKLDKRGIYIIPGTNLYWSNLKQGEQFIRVALNRDPEIFSKAGLILKKILSNLK